MIGCLTNAIRIFVEQAHTGCEFASPSSALKSYRFFISIVMRPICIPLTESCIPLLWICIPLSESCIPLRTVCIPCDAQYASPCIPSDLVRATRQLDMQAFVALLTMAHKHGFVHRRERNMRIHISPSMISRTRNFICHGFQSMVYYQIRCIIGRWSYARIV